MQLVDTHSHVYLQELASDQEAMMDRARSAGVSRIYMPAIDRESHPAMLELEQSYPGFCIAMMGLHPCSVKQDYKEELRVVEEYLSARPFAAVGEIGLDFYWDISLKEQQYDAFRTQIEWALHYKLPIVIHSRNSIDECLGVVAEWQRGALKGVFHCFSGNEEQAQRAIDLGFYLGIGGVVTFKNSGLDRVLGSVPLESIVLETDAPYLAPVPFRGKRNEPAYLSYVVAKLVEIKQVAVGEVASTTTANAQKLFGS